MKQYKVYALYPSGILEEPFPDVVARDAHTAALSVIPTKFKYNVGSRFAVRALYESEVTVLVVKEDFQLAPETP